MQVLAAQRLADGGSDGDGENAADEGGHQLRPGEHGGHHGHLLLGETQEGQQEQHHEGVEDGELKH